MPKLSKTFLTFILLCLSGCLPLKISEHQTFLASTLPIKSIADNTPTLTKIANPKRGEIYLNGIWQFIPALGNATQPPNQDWGKIWVPGDWRQENNPSTPGLINRGQGLAWQDYNGKELGKAWYQTVIDIPPNWQDRSILIDLNRVSTDAIIYIDGQAYGTINWPYGKLDITNAVTPGKKATLSILVTAVKNESEQNVVMGPNEIYKTESKLDSRGLIGDVRLVSLPKFTYIDDIFIQTSTRQKQLKLDLELAGIKQAGPVELIAQIFDQQGKLEREFNTTINVKNQQLQKLTVSWDWPNPRLWDVGQPNLYTLKLQVKGTGIDDELDRTFGFREFWIEGRKFYLNGTEIRFRPIQFSESWAGAIPAVTDRLIQGYIWAGYNIAELWPWNHYERGRWHFRELLADRADRLGFPLMAPALDVSQLASQGKWVGKAEEWEQQMQTELKRYRNHPSILIWANSPNYFGHSDDPNPLRIGQKTVTGTLGPEGDRRWQHGSAMGEKIVAKIKQYDPTRPVMLHQGAAVGEIYAINNYLNLIPLQEREEWLSSWSQSGNMPFMNVEFGTPLHTTMMRGRNGFRKTILSEPLMTEYAAIYLGKESYQLETPNYRQNIKELFVQDQEYKSWHFNHSLDFAPAFQKLQHLFSTNTWRSWRTYGITGGMIPWHEGHGWEGKKDLISLEPFQPNQPGPYLPQVRKSLWYNLQPEGSNIYPGGQAIMANNQPTLAWIAGGNKGEKSDDFVEKDRNFWAGESLTKQVVLINDTRTEQNFSYQWLAVVNGQQIDSGQELGKIAPATTKFFPIKMTLPSVNNKVDGEILLRANIGNSEHKDELSFRVFPNLNQSQLEPIKIFDPIGKTSQFLQKIGYSLTPWDGQASTDLVVIGREALSSGNRLPANLETFISNGGKVLVFSQQPDWIRQQLGWRVAQHQSRRVFPVSNAHPIMQRLDQMDLLNWRGASTLLEAYPDTRPTGPKLNPQNHPWYGWHWGNRGVVSNGAIEKPHFSAWRPILEAEFDLAYTPLMELNYGQGRLIWHSLDWEERILDPAAVQLAKQVISYATNAPIKAPAKLVNFIGNEAEAANLDAMGLVYQKVDNNNYNADLLIIGREAKINESELKNYLNKGGKVFFLPRYSPVNSFGISLAEMLNFAGSLNVPNWPETEGISMGEVRSRVNFDAWLIKSGGEIGADGLLSRVKVGEGVAIFCQIDPDRLNANTETYLRLTRWRYTRAQAQILANLGARFKADNAIFQLTPDQQYYHPDYRTDFELGDDPYRYYRW